MLSSRVKFMHVPALSRFFSTAAEWKDAKSYSEIPGPSSFGMIASFLPGGKYHNLNAIDLMTAVHEDYGQIVKLPGFFGKRDMVFLFDPNDIETAFRTEGKYPVRRGLDTLEYFRGTYRKDWFEKGAGLVPTQGHEWHEFRSKVNQTMMQPKTAKLYIPKVDEVVKDLIVKVKKNLDLKNEAPADFQDYISNWALESIALITLNRRLGIMENPESSKINQLIKKAFELSFEYDALPGIWRTIKTPGFINVMKTYESMTKTMKDYADEAMKEIDQAKSSDGEDAGVLEKLMKIDRHVAFVMVLDALIAGVDTTAAGAVSVMYSLGRYPEKQDKLRQEVMKILPEKSSELTSQSLNSIPYLRAVIKEAFRLHPPFNGNLRGAGQDLVIKGYKIPEDTDLYITTNIIPLQEKNFTKAKEFIPERWLKDNTDPGCPHAKDSHPFSYLPFGFGPRMCVGRRFAELEIEVLIIRMIREFEIGWNYPELKFKSASLNIAADPLKFKLDELKY